MGGKEASKTRPLVAVSLWLVLTTYSSEPVFLVYFLIRLGTLAAIFYFLWGTTVYLVDFFFQLFSSRQAATVSGVQELEVQFSLCRPVISTLFTVRDPKGRESEYRVAPDSTASFGLNVPEWGLRISSPLRKDHSGGYSPFTLHLFLFCWVLMEAQHPIDPHWHQGQGESRALSICNSQFLFLFH